ncbi:MAG: zinc ribbon domain-containing protein, partial [Oscillospiraceae bacterium]|nr:zinc ribbon domain-containing protein [Oscillospiraceae bacterium]
MAKFCTGCGAPIEDAAKFCVSCGTPNTQPEPQPQPQAAPPQYQQPQQYQQPYPAYPPPQPYAAPPAAAKPKKKHKGLKILLGFVGAIVLLIVSIPILLGAGGNMDYYNIGNEKVASVKLALGEKRKLSGTSSRVENGANIKAFTYGEPDRDQAADMSAYLKYL